ncbi:MAG: glycosyltransferase family 2 protein [Lachnospiraceae bacterium]
MEDERRIAAGIVTYNPEISRLTENVNRISGQVRKIYIFDNGSKNMEQIRNIWKEDRKIEMICSDINVGIASALNHISEAAVKDGMLWLLTLDQDSVVPKDTMKAFSQYLGWERIGIICPVIFDKRRPEKIPVFEKSYDLIDMCITSGSLVNLSVWEQVGKYDDKLFIGLVDDEYCLKIRIHNYQILRVNSVILDHELGNLNPSRFSEIYKQIAQKTGCSFFNKLSYKREVSPMRLYYGTRNRIYLNRKYKAYIGKEYTKKNYLYNGASSIIRGKGKITLFCSFVQGILDGKRM